MVTTANCWCCDSVLTTKGVCPICDLPGIISPPHICIKWGEIMGDEAVEFTPLPEDYETIQRKKNT